MAAYFGAFTMKRYGDRIVCPEELASIRGSSHLDVDRSRPAKREPYPTTVESAVDGYPFATAWITGEEVGQGIGATII